MDLEEQLQSHQLEIVVLKERELACKIAEVCKSFQL